MQPKLLTHLTHYAKRVAQSLSTEAQPYLPHVTPRVPRSFHAKFHADWTKTVGTRGMNTDGQTGRQTNRRTDKLSCFNNIDVSKAGEVGIISGVTAYSFRLTQQTALSHERFFLLIYFIGLVKSA